MLLKIGRTIGTLVPAALLSACSMMAAPYSPDVDNIQSLKNATAARARLATFDSPPSAKNPYPLPVRANTMRSPVGDSFGAYLNDAMKQELTIAGRLAQQDGVEVKATLLENDVSAGVGTGDATLAARFVVTRDGTVRYDQIKHAHTQWDSAFAAMIAVPKAREEYPHAVQKLLSELYADPAFMQAIQ
jgi:hypothetical protein